MAKLEHLDLTGLNSIGPAGLVLLGNISSLESLIVRGIDTVDDRVMQSVSRLKKLKKLDVSTCVGLTEDGVKHIGSMISLTALDLSGNSRLGQQRAWQHLLKLKNLEQLKVKSILFSEEQMTDFCAILPVWQNLSELRFGYCQIRDQHAQAFAKLPRLRTLSIHNASSLKADSYLHFSHVLDLDLSRSTIPVRALDHLQQLVRLEIKNSKFLTVTEARTIVNGASTNSPGSRKTKGRGERSTSNSPAMVGGGIGGIAPTLPVVPVFDLNVEHVGQNAHKGGRAVGKSGNYGVDGVDGGRSGLMNATNRRQGGNDSSPSSLSMSPPQGRETLTSSELTASGAYHSAQDEEEDLEMDDEEYESPLSASPYSNFSDSSAETLSAARGSGNGEVSAAFEVAASPTLFSKMHPRKRHLTASPPNATNPLTSSAPSLIFHPPSPRASASPLSPLADPPSPVSSPPNSGKTRRQYRRSSTSTSSAPTPSTATAAPSSSSPKHSLSSSPAAETHSPTSPAPRIGHFSAHSSSSSLASSSPSSLASHPPRSSPRPIASSSSRAPYHRSPRHSLESSPSAVVTRPHRLSPHSLSSSSEPSPTTPPALFLPPLHMQQIVEVRPLDALRNLRNLRQLSLRVENVTDADLSRISKCKRMKELDLLWLSHVTSRGLQNLARLKHLQQLNLTNCKSLDDDTLQIILPHMKVLRALSLAHCILVGDPGLLAIASNSLQLRYLVLFQLQRVTNEGITSLVTLGDLEVLEISGCHQIDVPFCQSLLKEFLPGLHVNHNAHARQHTSSTSHCVVS